MEGLQHTQDTNGPAMGRQWRTPCPGTDLINWQSDTSALPPHRHKPGDGGELVSRPGIGTWTQAGPDAPSALRKP